VEPNSNDYFSKYEGKYGGKYEGKTRGKYEGKTRGKYEGKTRGKYEGKTRGKYEGKTRGKYAIFGSTFSKGGKGGKGGNIYIVIVRMEVSTIYEFGEYGPIALILLSWYLLWVHKKLFFYYTIGIFINAILNIILKGLIQEPRPLFDAVKVKLATTRAKSYFYQNGIPFQLFGMPSGHAQASFFTTTFIYLSLKSPSLLVFYLAYSLFICYQRVKMDHHSISQVIAGSIVGSLFGYLMYKVARNKFKGRIREKPDDFGPI
jgi:membrane-associated phospholipid phosphatase